MLPALLGQLLETSVVPPANKPNPADADKVTDTPEETPVNLPGLVEELQPFAEKKGEAGGRR